MRRYQWLTSCWRHSVNSFRRLPAVCSPHAVLLPGLSAVSGLRHHSATGGVLSTTVPPVTDHLVMGPRVSPHGSTTLVMRSGHQQKAPTQ